MIMKTNTMRAIPCRTWVGALALLLSIAGCGTDTDSAGLHAGGHGDAKSGESSHDGKTAAVPVQTQEVVRRSISEYLQTNGTLEAENEVDLVARTTGPITELIVEEGDTLQKGQLLARIDDREPRNQVAVATVSRDEARLSYGRATTSHDSGLVSQEAYDAALSALQSAEAQLDAATIQLAYTEIRAPFDALVVARHIRHAQYVTPGTALFRISDFTPLLCPIEIPEKDLPRLHVGQSARIHVDAFQGEVFSARVQRIRPTIDASTGTVTVTLEVDGRRKLRPGMFASVFLQTATKDGALVIPRTALVLDSIGDTVYVRDGDLAARREVRLGVREEDEVEVIEGLSEGEHVVVLGQEGLADGTPVTVLGDEATPRPSAGTPDASRVEEIRARMRERGMSEEDIEQRLQQMRQRGDQAQGAAPGGDIPPFMEQRIREASPEDLEQIKQRMRSFGMSDERIDEIVQRIRGEE
jgi:RND family efflux transporter MFP subunit